MGEISSNATGPESTILSPTTIPLTTSSQGLKILLSQVSDFLGPYFDGLSDAKPITGPIENSLLESVFSSPPEQPTPIDELLPKIYDAAASGYEVSSPVFAGYFPPSNVVESGVGELISTVIQRHTAYRESAPGSAAFEDSMIQWMVQLVGLGNRAHGVLTTGGSNAILTAMIGMRERFVERGGDMSRARAYMSDEAHHCISRALHFAGIPRTAVHVIPTKSTRLDPLDMETAIKEDVAAGLEPMLMVATAGTTNTGNIEPLERLAKLASQYSMWYHVDGCYGGLFALTARGKGRLRGIDQADSVSLDPYKTLFYPLESQHCSSGMRGHLDAF